MKTTSLEYCKMLSIKKVFCVSLLYYFVGGNVVKNNSLNFHDIKEAPQKLPVSTPPGMECGPDKSFNSRNDIKILIDFIFYNETSSDKKIKLNYQSKAEAIRDKHLQDLNDFNEWFDNQPGHLKDVLQRLERIREVQVQPDAQIVADVLSEYPKLEMSYNKKYDKANKLFNKFNKYSMICKVNCEDQQVKEHNISKRQVQDNFYCSSLEDLRREITEKLDGYIEEINNGTLKILSWGDTKYEEKINEIKSKLKDKALEEFGRTMYDILSLEYEYHQFMNDMTNTDLHEAVYDIKSLGLRVDAKLLELEQAIEKFGQHCNSCGSKTLARKARGADLAEGAEAKITNELPNLVDELIEIKFDEFAAEVHSDFTNIFNVLDTLIQKTEAENDSIEKFKSIEGEINAMTNSEKEALSKLKNLAPTSFIKRILELIKKLKDLLKFIKDIFDKLLRQESY